MKKCDLCGRANSTAGRKTNPVFVFLVDGMLIDTGPKSAEKQLIPFYEQQSFDLVALTHSCEDHSGNASWIQKHQNVPIFDHAKGIDICAKPHPLYRPAVWRKKRSVCSAAFQCERPVLKPRLEGH